LIFRVSATAFVVVSALAAVPVLANGADALGLAEWLRAHGHPVYVAWLVWVVAAPLVLAAAAGTVRRTPWPWVASVTVQLGSLVAAQARLGHLLDDWSWAVVVVAVGAGLVSVVTAVDDRSGPAPG
jgi:hypothetical protein